MVGNLAIQSIGRNCSDNKSLRIIFRDALGDLALSGREVLITPRPRRFNHASGAWFLLHCMSPEVALFGHAGVT
jgi:hypothetical protein